MNLATYSSDIDTGPGWNEHSGVAIEMPDGHL